MINLNTIIKLEKLYKKEIKRGFKIDKKMLI